MKINKHWKLSRHLNPHRKDLRVSDATRKQYDSVCIIHFCEYFRPIVLDKENVISGRRWTAKRFYRGVNKAISVSKYGSRAIEVFGIWKNKNENGNVKWGCRAFTFKQLLIIKKAMEEHYGKERLGK